MNEEQTDFRPQLIGNKKSIKRKNQLSKQETKMSKDMMDTGQTTKREIISPTNSKPPKEVKKTASHLEIDENRLNISHLSKT